MDEETRRKKLLEQLDLFVEQLIDEVPFFVEDLPEFAGKLFDFHQKCPQLLQIEEWRHRNGLDYPPFAKRVVEEICSEIESAQNEGILPKKFPPRDLFSLIIKISAIGFDTLPNEIISERSIEKTRKLIVKSVEHLVK